MNVNERSSQLDDVSDDWDMLDALMGGTGAMRKAAAKFLPQWPNEDGDSYKERLNTAVLHPVYRRTCKVMAAKPFSRPISVEVAPELQEFLENIDMSGTPFSAFAMGTMMDVLSKGLFGVLVDYPQADGIKTKADEKKAGVRPYLTTYTAKSILGWRVKNSKLVQLRLMESVEEDEGEFGTENVEQVRVLTPGAWQIYRENDKGDWILHEEGTTTLDFIPFVFFYGEKLAYGVGRTPLLDLAFQNVEHWQSASDQQTILHVARVPILFAKGFGDDDNITIGAKSATSTDNADADLKFVEHSGEAIEAGRKSLLDLEDRMRATGAELISNKDVSNVTATQIDSEDSGNKSVLQQIAEDLEESLEACLDMMAAWIGAQQGAEVELYKDFNAPTGTDPQHLSDAKDAKVISGQTMFEELQRRDIIAPDRKWEDEQKRIQAEQPPDPTKTDELPTDQNQKQTEAA